MNEVVAKAKERAILVGLGNQYTALVEPDMPDALNELRLLAQTAGAEVVGAVIQRSAKINPSYFIGIGKVHDLKTEVEKVNADMVIFDNELKSAQVSNLEKYLNIKVIDRSGIILDIFAQRARTREAKTQVELAQLKYLLPRLTRQWVHLSRQQGGIGVRGPGETQLEVDRRRIRQRIIHLTDVLKKIEVRHKISRQKRLGCFRAALVGYTNTGKSTLLNTLSGADVPVEDKLFKTLDSVTRVLRFKLMPEILISDTVGFIRNLPHDLIASFKSTLDEVRDADVLLHIVDITNFEWEKQIEVVMGVLTDLGVSNSDTIMVFNKIDLLNDTMYIETLRIRYPEAVFVSGEYGTGIDDLKTALANATLKDRLTMTLEFGPEKGNLLSDIYRYGTILETIDNGDSIKLSFTIPRTVAEKLGLSG